MLKWVLFLLFIFVSGLLAACNSRAYLPNFSVSPSPTPPPGFLSLNNSLPNEFLSQASLSADGRLLATLGSDSEESSISQLLVFDLTTKGTVYNGTEELWTSAALSPDGTQIAACGNLSSKESIYLIDWRSQSIAYLADGCWPAWSPDGHDLAFVHYTSKQVGPERHAQIRVRELSSDKEKIVFDTLSPNGFIGYLTWSPMAERLAFSMAIEITEDPDSKIPHLYTVKVDGGDFRMITHGTQHPISPSFSPDGSKILYVDWSAPLHAESEYLQVIDLEGQCHRLDPPLPGINRVALSQKGDKIAFDYRYGLAVAKTKVALGDVFWNVGDPCIIP